MTAQDLLDPSGRYRLRVDDYRLLDESGAFETFAKTELIEGEVVAVQSQYGPHSIVQTKLLLELSTACAALGDVARPWVELSVAIGPFAEPRPDIVVSYGPPGEGPIAPSRVAIVVEVCDTTAAVDLGRKIALYATAGIPEYWVADVNARTIRQMWGDAEGGYAERRELAFGERIASATIAGLSVETSGLG